MYLIKINKLGQLEKKHFITKLKVIHVVVAFEPNKMYT